MMLNKDENLYRLLKLQSDHKNGLIEESEISKEDYQKLLNLYDEQNKNIQQQIEKDRIQIRNMLNELKRKK